VRRAYNDPDNKLRASVLADPAGKRKNTKDNTPAVINVDRPRRHRGRDRRRQGRRLGGQVQVRHAQPVRLHRRLGAQDRADHGRRLVPAGHARHRHRRHRREGDAAGQGSADGADRHHELQARGASNRAEELRLELYEKVNALGIGAQGLGGLTTVLDVKIKDYPTHAANLPVAMIPNCAATRHAHFTLDGSGPVMLEPPSLEDWPKLTYNPANARRVNLDTLTKEEVASWKPGECCCSTARC
jgi:fumarate hydratase class I